MKGDESSKRNVGVTKGVAKGLTKGIDKSVTL